MIDQVYKRILCQDLYNRLPQRSLFVIDRVITDQTPVLIINVRRRVLNENLLIVRIRGYNIRLYIGFASTPLVRIRNRSFLLNLVRVLKSLLELVQLIQSGGNSIHERTVDRDR